MSLFETKILIAENNTSDSLLVITGEILQRKAHLMYCEFARKVNSFFSPRAFMYLVLH